ncbi:MAG: GDP-L-fucose synthase [Planctomycetaceae bacterium]|nr:GDP-L-fucose synthase [Planctomycetaceae bacterium]
MKHRIFVAGHRGMVGAAIVRSLNRTQTAEILTRTRAELDLCNREAVQDFLSAERPDVVILAAARVGGIQANLDAPAEFIYENLQIQNSVIHGSWVAGVRKLCFLGSSCIYPRLCPQPMKEEYLLTGPVEPTNEGYAIAKIAGLKMAQAYHRQYGMDVLCAMPCNLYGPNDSFDLQKSHVLSALVRRFVDAHDSQIPSLTLWGTGAARREFMHVDDLAEAVLFAMEHWQSPEVINIGTGVDVSIRELAEAIAAEVGFKGELKWDTSKPDGMPRKCMDVSRLQSLGYESRISLSEGIRQMISEYRCIKSNSIADNDLKDKVNDSAHEERIPSGAGNPTGPGGIHSGSAAA